MSRGAAHLVSETWSGQATREVYSDFNDLTLQIVTDALFGFRASNPDSQNVTGTAQDCRFKILDLGLWRTKLFSVQVRCKWP